MVCKNNRINSASEKLSWVVTKDIVTSAQNDHTKTIKDNWNSFPTDVPFFCRMKDNNFFVVIGYRYGDSANGGCVLIGHYFMMYVGCMDGQFTGKTITSLI